jgi:hypothetical protein
MKGKRLSTVDLLIMGVYFAQLSLVKAECCKNPSNQLFFTKQGTLHERERLSTIDLLIKVACFAQICPMIAEHCKTS